MGVSVSLSPIESGGTDFTEGILRGQELRWITAKKTFLGRREANLLV